MAKIITASIDLTQLDKKRFKEMTRKNGNKAVFCELVLIESTNKTHGDYFIKQGVTKEERQQRVEMPIIGNAKNVGGVSRQSDFVPETVVNDDSQIPF